MATLAVFGAIPAHAACTPSLPTTCTPLTSGTTCTPTTADQLFADMLTLNSCHLDGTIHLASDHVYTLPSSYAFYAISLPEVITTVRIVGNGATIERKTPAPTSRFFDNHKNLTLENLTLQNGYVDEYGGGAVWNTGTLTLTGCILKDNKVGSLPAPKAAGGAVFNEGGTVNINRCTFIGNAAPHGGGLASYGSLPNAPSIFPSSVAKVTITNSAFVHNEASLAMSHDAGMGGGFALLGAHQAKVTSVTVSDNRAYVAGGGIALDALPAQGGNQALYVNFVNLTIANNKASGAPSGSSTQPQGGGVYFTAQNGGGKYAIAPTCSPCPPALAPAFANSIIANNVAGTAASNYASDYGFASAGHNVIGPGSGPFALLPSDTSLSGPLTGLGPLSSTGDAGSESLHPLASASLLINQGDPSLCLPLDQLGFGRVGTCEIGAVEYRSCVAPPSGMTAWWPFDTQNFLQDYAKGGVSDNATPIPPSTSSPLSDTGMVAGAATFTNAAQKLQVQHSSDIDLRNTCFTIADASFSIDAWVKTAQTTGLQVILDKRGINGNGQETGYHLFIFNGRLGVRFAHAAAPTYNYLTAAPPFGPNLSDNQWHFVAVTVNATCSAGVPAFDGKMYIDGVFQRGFPMNGSNYSNSQPLIIGGRSPAIVGAQDSVFFNGSLDEIEIFQRTLTATEIANLYNAGWAGKCK